MTQLVPDWALRSPAADETVLLFAGGRPVLQNGQPRASLQAWQSILRDIPEDQCLGPITIGRDQGRWIHAVSIPEEHLSDEWETQSLRQYLIDANPSDWQQVSTAAQLLQWMREHRYCGRCGQPTRPADKERALHCEPCNHNWYPRLSPCVIVTVRRENQILLARAPHYPPGLFSLVAGFIEAGETAEEAVQREVAEETGIDVDNVRYWASQSWPFPHQLMLGFSADYRGGELVLQEDEIVAADWFDVDRLPPIPGEHTIAGQLIRKVVRAMA